MSGTSYGPTNYCIMLKRITLSLASGPKFKGGICSPCLTLATAWERNGADDHLAPIFAFCNFIRPHRYC